MKTELTMADLETLQDALAYKLLWLKDQELTAELTRMDTLPIMRLIGKLEAMREERDEDSIGTERD